MITPDLTPEEAGPWLAAADKHGARPGLPGRAVVHRRAGGADRRSLPRFRLRDVGDGRDRRPAATSAAAPGLVARVRAVTDLPVGVGLGVSNGDQAAEVAGYADGVIVGSAFVRACSTHRPKWTVSVLSAPWPRTCQQEYASPGPVATRKGEHEHCRERSRNGEIGGVQPGPTD